MKRFKLEAWYLKGFTMKRMTGLLGTAVLVLIGALSGAWSISPDEYCHSAEISLRNKLYDDALRAYLQALQEESDNKKALMGLAQLYTSLGKYQKALDQIRILEAEYSRD